MKKNKQDLLNREMFVQMCVEQPQDGARYLRDIAKKISKSKKTAEVIKHLKKVLFIHEATMYRDLENY